jgi:mannose-6-phosphate isomerase-like protein (cupin superfamily)
LTFTAVSLLLTAVAIAACYLPARRAMKGDMPVGFASPYHTHRREDESFYVLDGKVAFVCNGEWLEAGPGAFVYGPRDIAHGFKVIGERPARMLVMCTPAGFEQFILDQAAPIEEPPSPPDMGRLMMLAERHGIEIHGPLPRPPGE